MKGRTTSPVALNSHAIPLLMRKGQKQKWGKGDLKDSELMQAEISSAEWEANSLASGNHILRQFGWRGKERKECWESLNPKAETPGSFSRLGWTNTIENSLALPPRAQYQSTGNKKWHPSQQVNSAE